MKTTIQTRSGLWMKVYLIIIGLIVLFLGLVIVINPVSLRLPAGGPLGNNYMRRIFGSLVVVTGMAYILFAPQFLKHWRKLVAALSVQVALMALFLIMYFISGYQFWFGLLLLLNFALLSLPIARIVYTGFEYRRKMEEQLNYFYSSRVSLEALLVKTNKNISLLELSTNKPTMLVFLRHFGCTFCRETLATLSREYKRISAMGTQIVIVHMALDREAENFIKRYNLENVHLISDPGQLLYDAFSLERGTLNQLLGIKVLTRAFLGGVLWRNFQGKTKGDPKQLPGVFLLYQGGVVKSYKHYTAADTPDYVQLASCNSCI